MDKKTEAEQSPVTPRGTKHSTKDLQKKYIELQLAAMQIKQIEEQIDLLEQRILDLVNLRNSLDKLSSSKANTPALNPISPGIFVPGTIDATNGVFVNVGAGVVVKKDISAAKETINSQLKQLEDMSFELNQNLQILAERAHIIERELTE